MPARLIAFGKGLVPADGVRPLKGGGTMNVMTRSRAWLVAMAVVLFVSLAAPGKADAQPLDCSWEILRWEWAVINAASGFGSAEELGEAFDAMQQCFTRMLTPSPNPPPSTGPGCVNGCPGYAETPYTGWPNGGGGYTCGMYAVYLDHEFIGYHWVCFSYTQ